jgi:hypothetical protein
MVSCAEFFISCSGYDYILIAGCLMGPGLGFSLAFHLSSLVLWIDLPRWASCSSLYFPSSFCLFILLRLQAVCFL